MLKLSNLESIGKPVYKFQNKHSVDFDGVDDFIQLGEPISYTQHTISTWVKFSDEATSRVIFDARDSNDDGISIFVTSLEKITYRIGDGSGSDLTSDSLTINEWHHIVATYDGTTQKLYINGSLNQSATTSKTIDTTTNAKIGIVAYVDSAPFKGKIDELAIFDRALEEEEVTKIYRIKYGANLVQNGNFDELGSELATNGNFDTSIPIGTAGSYWEASTGSAEYHLGGVKMIADNSNICRLRMLLADNGTLILPLEKTFRITYTVLERNNIISTGFTIYMAGNNHTLSTDLGTHTFYLDSGNNSNKILQFQNNTFNSDITIDNVSVKQVDPNDRWTLGTGWSITNGKLVGDGTNTGFENAQQNNLTVVGKTYKVTLTIEATSGQVELKGSGVYSRVDTLGVGTHTLTFVADATYFRFLAHAGATITITNVMLEQQKYVATNLKLNSIPYSSSNLRNYYRMGDGILDTHPLICDMVEPSLGSELVLNGTFNSDVTNWTESNVTAQRDTSIFTNGSAKVTVTGSVSTFITQTISGLTVGKIYNFSSDLFTPSTNTNTNVATIGIVPATFTSANSISNSATDTIQKKSLNFIASSTTQIIYLSVVKSNYLQFGTSGNIGYFDNVSVKLVNGVAGLMTNMSESDITNDVPS